MDLIGRCKLPFSPTESVFRMFMTGIQCITQLKLVEADWLGKKSGRGFLQSTEDVIRFA